MAKHEFPTEVISLPSEGKCYPKENPLSSGQIEIKYMTAREEEILTSQNLIQKGTVIDELLKAKILDKDISVDDLHDSDKEAVLLFLRNTAYGSMINLVVTDPDTNQKVEIEYDLQNVKFKEFNLESDSEGLFSYTTETNQVIKFRFLTPKDEEELAKIDEVYKDMVVKPTVTKRLEKMIVEVDGERDPMKLSHFIQFLPIKESQRFRKFVSENTPGLDKEVELILPSGKKIQTFFGLDTEFFRPFYGL